MKPVLYRNPFPIIMVNTGGEIGLSSLTDPVLSDRNVFLFWRLSPLRGAKVAGAKSLLSV